MLASLSIHMSCTRHSSSLKKGGKRVGKAYYAIESVLSNKT